MVKEKGSTFGHLELNLGPFNCLNKSNVNERFENSAPE